MPESAPKKNLVIIDDDKFLLDMYTKKFTDKEYLVTPCSSAEEGLELVRGGVVPDIFLVDVVMRGMDGFSFVKELKEGKFCPDAAVIILSNLGQREDIENGLKYGADGYIVKASATPSEVVQKVEEIVSHKK